VQCGDEKSNREQRLEREHGHHFAADAEQRIRGTCGEAGSFPGSATVGGFTEPQALVDRAVNVGSTGNAVDGLLNTIKSGRVNGMDITITMDSAGRIVLPKPVRELLHLRGGARLKANVSADRIELIPEPDSEVNIVRRGRRLVVTGLAKEINAVAGIQEDREDRDVQVVRRVR
jgi:AbrB family looped-hinge helix DNA binding protein